MLGTTAPPIMTAMANHRPLIYYRSVDHAVDEPRRRDLPPLEPHLWPVDRRGDPTPVFIDGGLS
jgi:hypothetical protein